MTDTRPPTGERIAAEIEREMEDHLYRLRHVVLAPAEYYVYLHVDDYEHVEGVVPRIVHDVQMCLNVLVERLNTQSRISRLVAGKRAPIEVPAGGWAVYIRPAVNGDVGRGELGIHSRLSIPPASRFGTGAGTTRIFQTVVTAAGRRTEVSSEPPLPELRTSVKAGPYVPTGPASARLSYQDDSGPHTYILEKELTKVGRGGAAHWVDVAVVSGSKVSREHCRIRRDAGGRCFVQDVSRWGTSVNGQPVPKYVDGEPSAALAERELLDGAVIQLADLIDLTFRKD